MEGEAVQTLESVKQEIEREIAEREAEFNRKAKRAGYIAAAVLAVFLVGRWTAPRSNGGLPEFAHYTAMVNGARVFYCPKCSKMNISQRFVPQAYWSGEPEHMEYRCNECRYHWPTAVMLVEGK